MSELEIAGQEMRDADERERRRGLQRQETFSQANLGGDAAGMRLRAGREGEGRVEGRSGTGGVRAGS